MNPPYVSVNLMGGLGNQMFQIATAYAYAKRTGGCLRLLKDKRMNDGRSMYWDSTLYRWTLYNTNSLPPNLKLWREVGATEYTPIPELPSTGLFLYGYFQSSKYFGDSETRREIRERMKATPEQLEYIQAKYASLLKQKERVVVVHARRTDYLHKANAPIHGPLTIDYYQRAIERMSTLVESPIFLLCSDDNRFWTENASVLPENDYHILSKDSDVNTLALLQQFPHFIIANSTFSWWAAWLAEARNVIAPTCWFGPAGPQRYEDIYESTWERM